MTYLASSVEATDEYVLRSVDIDQDAEKLAQMWSSSDDQWPGTWSRGVPITAQRLRDWLKREKRVDALVWDTGDAIAGYCSLWEWLDEPNVTYIALLNVAPEYQKQSLARKFLTHYVERAIKLGSVRLDLHTWSGNLKAVPLYKKCGFFWLPGTSVHMLNFLPTILTMPCTQSFFAKHDWYRSFKRELAQNEDDERWEGMKVFTYRFEEDGDSLTVWVDRESRTVTAVDTDDFFAAAIADELEPPRGLPTTVRWKLANKRDRPVQLSLIAGGTEHLKLDHRTAMELAPGEAATLSASVRIAAQAPDTEQGKPAPFVKSLLIVDGEVFELGTGLRPQPMVEVSTEPEYLTLLPGVPQTIELQLRSHLKCDAEATVSVAPAQGLTAEWTQQSVPLAAEGYSGRPLKLSAETSGVFELPVSLAVNLDGEQVRQPAKPLAVFVLPIGGVLGAHVDGKLRVENDTVRLLMDRQGAELTIRDRTTNAWLGFQSGYAAPPVRPSEYSGAFDLSLDRHPDRVVAVATMASREHPGFVLHKRITVGAGPVFTVDYDFENLGAEERTFQLAQMLGGNSEKAMLTLPLAAGLVRGSWEEFPGPADDESKQAGAYAERWAALEYGQTTLGIVWAPDVEEIESTWGLNLLTHLYECAPQSRVQPGSLQVYVGDGDWRTVQRLWRRLVGETDTEARTLPEPAAPLRARIDPPVVVAADGTAQTALLVENLLSRKFAGNATLRLPESWQASSTEFELTDLYWKQPYRAELRFTTSAEPGAATGTIALRSAEFDADYQLPLVRLGDGRAVEIRRAERDDQPILTITNGRLEIDVTPGFAGTVSAIREGGVNHLLSPFPRVGQLGWLAPWHGGLTPVLTLAGDWDFPGKLRQETFAVEPVSSRDVQGIEWQGLRQHATLSLERLRGLLLQIDTLTVGGSPVVKQVMRFINTTSVARHLETTGWVAFVQPDGSYSRTTLWGPEPRKQSDRMYDIFTGHWAAAENPDTGRAVGLISPRPDAAILGWGRDGGHLQVLTHLAVPANATSEVVGYIVVADDIEAAKRFGALKDLT